MIVKWCGQALSKQEKFTVLIEESLEIMMTVIVNLTVKLVDIFDWQFRRECVVVNNYYLLLGCVNGGHWYMSNDQPSVLEIKGGGELSKAWR